MSSGALASPEPEEFFETRDFLLGAHATWPRMPENFPFSIWAFLPGAHASPEMPETPVRTLPSFKGVFGPLDAGDHQVGSVHQAGFTHQAAILLTSAGKHWNSDQLPHDRIVLMASVCVFFRISAASW